MTLVKFRKHPASGNLNGLINDFFHPASHFRDDFEMRNQNVTVPVNISETQNNYQLDLIAPGYAKEDFKMNLEGNVLSISVENEREDEKEDEIQYLRQEFSITTFKRSFKIDKNIDADQISAEYVNGILKLKLPKRPEMKVTTKQITVQ